MCIGKTGKNFLIEGENEYLGRLKHYVPVERIEIPDIKNTKKLTFDQIKELEGKEILSKVNSGEQLILLDEEFYFKIQETNYYNKWRIDS